MNVLEAAALTTLYLTGFTGVLVQEQTLTATLAATIMLHVYLAEL